MSFGACVCLSSLSIVCVRVCVFAFLIMRASQIRRRVGHWLSCVMVHGVNLVLRDVATSVSRRRRHPFCAPALPLGAASAKSGVKIVRGERLNREPPKLIS